MVVASTGRAFSPCRTSQPMRPPRHSTASSRLDLLAEVARFGVKVTALCPGPTESEFAQVARSGGRAVPGGLQTAEEVARLGVAALARGQRTIIPYFGGRLTAMLVRVLPVSLITYFIEKKARPRPVNR